MLDHPNDVTLALPHRKPDERFAMTVNGVKLRHVKDVEVFCEGSVTYVSVTFMAAVNVPKEP